MQDILPEDYELIVVLLVYHILWAQTVVAKVLVARTRILESFGSVRFLGAPRTYKVFRVIGVLVPSL